MRQYRLLWIGIACILLSGCSHNKPFEELWISPRPYLREHPAVRPHRSVMDANNSRLTLNNRGENINPIGPITLHDAISLAMHQNPALEASGWSVTMARADALQMGRPRNPTLGLNIENFGGPDRLKELPRQTLRISQVIELAGKRQKRQELGEAIQRLKAWDYEQKRIELAANVGSLFIRVVIAQERIELAQRQLALAESAYRIADDRASIGTRPGFERDQALTRLSLSRIKLEQAKENLHAERANLASLWGVDDPRFEWAQGNIFEQYELPELDQLKHRLQESPQIARWQDELEKSERAIDLERAKAIPDPAFGTGVRYLSDIDVTVGLAEVSWPLPLLDDNRHAVLASRLRLAQTRSQQSAAIAEAHRKLAVTYAQAQASQTTFQTLTDNAIPAAEQAYRAANSAYESGQAEYLSVLEAERSLLELLALQLDAAQSYHIAIIELEKITAFAIDASSNSK